MAIKKDIRGTPFEKCTLSIVKMSKKNKKSGNFRFFYFFTNSDMYLIENAYPN